MNSLRFDISDRLWWMLTRNAAQVLGPLFPIVQLEHRRRGRRVGRLDVAGKAWAAVRVWAVPEEEDWGDWRWAGRSSATLPNRG